jgi:hypothetical protein
MHSHMNVKSWNSVASVCLLLVRTYLCHVKFTASILQVTAVISALPDYPFRFSSLVYED